MEARLNDNHALGTWPADWFELDVDSDTEGYVEGVQRMDDLSNAFFERSIREEAARFTFEHIPEELYDKAKDHRDQLTQAETTLLLSRGDVVGKALVQPEDLTIDEKFQVLRWPPPDTVRFNIQRATRGTLSTPQELYSKVKNAMDRGVTETLNDDEITLLNRNFYAMDDPAFGSAETMNILVAPGTGPAMESVLSGMGMGWRVFRDADAICEQRRRAERTTLPHPGPGQQIYSANHIINDIFSFIQQIERGEVRDQEAAARKQEYFDALIDAAASNTYGSAVPFIPDAFTHWPEIPPASYTDRAGSNAWPPTFRVRSAIDIFCDDTHLSGYGVEAGWFVVPEINRQMYRIQSETIRQRAWVTYNMSVTEGRDDFTWPQRSDRQLRPSDLGPDEPFRRPLPTNMRGRRPEIVTAFKLFLDNLGAGIGFEDALARWENLTNEQKLEYETRAQAANAAGFDTFWQFCLT